MERAPVFVKVNDYEEVLTLLENVKRKVRESRDALIKLNELKEEEDRELLAWNESIDEINTRIAQIDKNLSGQQ